MAFAKYSFTDRVVEKTSRADVKTTNATNKFLICLPFWSGDRAQAMKLARLLADLEDGHSRYADFLFVARFDCEHDDDTVKYVSRKFNVHTHISKRRSTGWPSGCNGLFFGAMEWVYHKLAKKQIPHYKFVFNIGADSGPLKRDWAERLSKAWDSTVARKKICVAGPFLKDSSGGHDHINGDAMLLSTDVTFLKWLAITVSDIKNGTGWDWALAGDFRNRGWEAFPFIKSIWRKPYMSHEEWDWEYAQQTVWIHGIKSDDLLDISRKNLV